MNPPAEPVCPPSKRDPHGSRPTPPTGTDLARHNPYHALQDRKWELIDALSRPPLPPDVVSGPRRRLSSVRSSSAPHQQKPPGGGFRYWADWLDLQAQGPIAWRQEIESGIKNSSKARGPPLLPSQSALAPPSPSQAIASRHPAARPGTAGRRVRRLFLPPEPELPPGARPPQLLREAGGGARPGSGRLRRHRDAEREY